MYRQTLAHIKRISMSLPDPNRAELAMHNLMSCSVKLCKKVLTKNLVLKMCRCNLTLEDVNVYTHKLCRHNYKNDKRIKNLRRILMKEKAKDTENECRLSKREMGWRYREYHKIVPSGSKEDAFFRAMMIAETGRVWEEGKKKNSNKIEHMKQQYEKSCRENTETKVGENRDILYGDKELENINHSDNESKSQPRIYGGAQISEKGKILLEKDPNFMTLGKINLIEIEVAVEVALAKARWEKSRGEDANNEEGENRGVTTNNNRNGSREITPGSINYAGMRATEIPTVQRLYTPNPGTVEEEVIMENIKMKMINTAREYMKEYCDEKGNIKNNNLSKEEAEGLKEIKDKIKNGDIVVFATDKSGRFSVDTPENYIEAVQKHTTDDIEITTEGVTQREHKINLHMRQFNKMFRVGEEHDHEDRVTGATMSTNVQPPPLYGLRKDHKDTPDKEKGPPVRPVCGANSSPNSRLSHFISKIINDYADHENISTECRSSEEMRAAFEEFNKREVETKEACKIISMDVKALYPSMEWEEIIKSVREMIEGSDMEIENVDWKEVGKYLAVSMTKEEIEREGLRKVVPERKGENLRKITVSYLNNKNNDDQWENTRAPGKKQKRKMLGLIVAEGVKTCLENHMYCVGDTKYLQVRGGPIGLELTGAVSRPFMARWDRIYLERVNKAGIKMMLYERYVDDSNQAAIVPPPGTRYNRERKKIYVDQQMVEEDEKIEADERLLRLLLDIANSIMNCVTMEGDCPSRNEDNKLPILDMKTWNKEDGTILFQHYEKKVSSKKVIHSESAHSNACKRSVHTQEILRRLMNSSSGLNWKLQVAPVITEYLGRMKKAGYGEKYRKTVLQHALQIYDEKWKMHKEGKRPIYRPKNYKKEERKLAKQRKKTQWAKKGGHIAPLFVPATPGSQLMKMMRKVAKEEGKEGIKFNVVESGGITLKRKLQKSNPTASPGCDKEDCLCCQDERGQGGQCHSVNVNYEIVCELCQKKYIGESSRNLKTRMDEHQGRDGFMRKHMQEKHPGEESKFKPRTTHINKHCLTRQVREGVLIRHNDKSLNSKSEWHLPAVFRVNNEVIRD